MASSAVSRKDCRTTFDITSHRWLWSRNNGQSSYGSHSSISSNLKFRELLHSLDLHVWCLDSHCLRSWGHQLTKKVRSRWHLWSITDWTFIHLSDGGSDSCWLSGSLRGNSFDFRGNSITSLHSVGVSTIWHSCEEGLLLSMNDLVLHRTLGIFELLLE